MVNDRSMHSAMVNVRAPIDDEKILKECQQIVFIILISVVKNIMF